MSGVPTEPALDPRGLARALAGEESELSRAARQLADRREADLETWLGLVERAAVALRRAARDLERQPAIAADPTPRKSPGPASSAPAAPARAAQRTSDDDPPLATSDGVLSGHASVVPVSDLLAFLSGLRRSGMLWVETEREGFLVQLREGAVVYAQGDNPPRNQLLGEILVEAGALQRDALEAALGAASKERKVLGTWLVNAGRISQGDLTTALATQVQMIFDRMFGARDARWQFEDGTHMVESSDVRLNVIQLLLESARASDESLARTALELGLPLARAL
jgi:hypothetical protein